MVSSKTVCPIFRRFCPFFFHSCLKSSSVFTEKDGRFFDGFCHVFISYSLSSPFQILCKNKHFFSKSFCLTVFFPIFAPSFREKSEWPEKAHSSLCS